MLEFKNLLLTSGIALFALAAMVIAYDAWLQFQYRRALSTGRLAVEPKPVRWRMTLGLFSLAWAPMLIACSLLVASGSADVRTGEIRGMAETACPSQQVAEPVARAELSRHQIFAERHSQTAPPALGGKSAGQGSSDSSENNPSPENR